MVTKKEGIDFFNTSGALTLGSDEIGTHKDGWTITGEIHEDWYKWVNEFEAVHPNYGRVWGNFEDEVYADSEEGYQNFYENHEPHSWDYQDI